MSDHQKLKETLSALLDNEAGKLDQLELRRLVRSLDENPELVETYQRYLLARTSLKGEPLPANSLLVNVRSALEQEEMEEVIYSPSAITGKDDSKRNWLKAVGRFAIAASVAVIAITVVQLRSVNAVKRVDITIQPEQVSSEVATTHSNRVLNPEVMTVSAGDRQAFEQTRQNQTSGCVLSQPRADKSNLIWEKELPEGYVFCKQNGQTRQCEAISTKIGCYLN